jgi:hypothetical protein
MHVAKIPNRGSSPTYLLRETYREGGQVKHRTVGNITSLVVCAKSVLNYFSKLIIIYFFNIIVNEDLQQTTTENMEVIMTAQRKSSLENKSASYQQKLRRARQKARDLAKRNRDLTKRKDYYKSRTKELTQELKHEKDLKQKGCLGVPDRSIAKHHYTEVLVKLTVGLVMICGCSLRSTVKIIGFFNELLGWHLPIRIKLSFKFFIFLGFGSIRGVYLFLWRFRFFL